MLINWNFQDEVANSNTQQINRQKSARNLDILEFDPSEPRAVFFDPKRNAKNTATLSACDCNDFNLAGASPRKSFKPCMHIYRLAIEMGIVEAKYSDHRARFALAAKSSRDETGRLQSLALDASQWGNWSAAIHASGIQRNRQYRAYRMYHDEHDMIQVTADGWRIHGYAVALSLCGCMDFLERKLPCKHIYCAALASNIPLPFNQADYDDARSRGLEIVFEFVTGA